MSKREDEPDGQVSEVGRMEPDDADSPISDSQGVAGNPEGPDADEIGEAGPNANPQRGRDTH